VASGVLVRKVMRGASRALGIEPPNDDTLYYREDDEEVHAGHPIADNESLSEEEARAAG
jgi:hypothetical protein